MIGFAQRGTVGVCDRQSYANLLFHHVPEHEGGVAATDGDDALVQREEAHARHCIALALCLVVLGARRHRRIPASDFN